MNNTYLITISIIIIYIFPFYEIEKQTILF